MTHRDNNHIRREREKRLEKQVALVNKRRLSPCLTGKPNNKRHFTKCHLVIICIPNELDILIIYLFENGINSEVTAVQNVLSR